jgi:hypothetical protein
MGSNLHHSRSLFREGKVKFSPLIYLLIHLLYLPLLQPYPVIVEKEGWSLTGRNRGQQMYLSYRLGEPYWGTSLPWTGQRSRCGEQREG